MYNWAIRIEEHKNYYSRSRQHGGRFYTYNLKRVTRIVEQWTTSEDQPLKSKQHEGVLNSLTRATVKEEHQKPSTEGPSRWQIKISKWIFDIWLKYKTCCLIGHVGKCNQVPFMKFDIMVHHLRCYPLWLRINQPSWRHVLGQSQMKW